MTTREALYRLVDSIPAAQLDDARQRLEPLADPVLAALANAPYDDEPETDEEREAVAEARADLDAGNFVTLDEVRREFGLLAGQIAVPDDFDRMGEAEIAALFNGGPGC